MASKRKTAGKRFFSSLNEFEKTYFPNSYKSRIEDQKHKKPGSFGEELAAQLLEDISRRIAK